MTKHVAVIGGVSENGVYGEADKIPWYLPEDFKQFKEKTTGSTVVMGRGTWESLPVKFRPLPNRHNMVVTNTPDYVAIGATVSRSVEMAVADALSEKVFCIGGVSIWYHAMHFADEAFISVVHGEYPVTSGITHLAKELLIIDETWPSFRLDSVTHFHGFDLHHWVKNKI
jgi:dihydrofolate reductase